MNSEHACNAPHHILGVTIRSRTHIYVSYVIPNVLELLVYIVQIAADCAVSYQHFKSGQSEFGWATLSLILIPPFVTCVLILTSSNQWSKPKANGARLKFVCKQLLQMILFPFFVIYRFAKLLFWSIDALFHDEDDRVRMECLEKAEECSTCELYRLIQSYGQSAPQIILQLFHMLTQDLFRNFHTTNVQAISLVLSAIDLAATTTTYQRFESQKQVGRLYPWSTERQREENKSKIKKNQYFQAECLRRKQDSERTLNKFPESDKIMENFKARNQDSPHTKISINLQTVKNESLFHVSVPKSHTVQLVHGIDEVDSGTGNEQVSLLATHLTDEEIKTTKSVLNKVSVTSADQHEFDKVPTIPPPSPPKAATFDNINKVSNSPQLCTHTSRQNSNYTNKGSSRALSQIENFKGMLIMNAQLYIKENVPRPPKMFIKRFEDTQNGLKTPPSTPKTPQDVVDYFLPGPTKVMKGIQQDDFAGKTIAFFGWLAFVTMRLLSLSAFSVFFPQTFLITMAVHYLIMLAALCLESRFNGKLNRTFFFLVLAYVYIYVLLEFRIKFIHTRIWFVGYIFLSIGENLTMTLIWYTQEEFDSWWFQFIFEGVIYSGILFTATIIVYYIALKPKDVLFLMEEKSATRQTNLEETTATDN